MALALSSSWLVVGRATATGSIIGGWNSTRGHSGGGKPAWQTTRMINV